MPRNTFTKAERLKSEKLIGELFEKGASVESFPLRIIFIPLVRESPFPVQATFSASKRNFARAVDRNRIKRLMREAYRLQKATLYSFLEERKKQIALMVIFTGKRLPDFKQIEGSLPAALQLLREKV
ncbi:MAG: ribonuclease P protein component [Chitinophagales bacterium]|nr:ribonuclease P protein component [Chitinophagales bacterium]